MSSPKDYTEEEYEAAQRAAHLLGKDAFLALIYFARRFLWLNDSAIDRSCDFDNLFGPRKTTQDGGH